MPRKVKAPGWPPPQKLRRMEREQRPYTLIDYLHGKVADFTVSANAIEAICYERGYEPSTQMCDVDVADMHLCYGDLLKYIYIQPGITKSYSQTNGTWSHKEGATQLSANDKNLILAEMRKQYAQGGEPESAVQPKQCGIRIESHGIKPYPLHK